MKLLYKWLATTLAGAATMFVWEASPTWSFQSRWLQSYVQRGKNRFNAALILAGDGLYLFPNIDLRGNPTAEKQAAWEARFRASPTGMSFTTWPMARRYRQRK